MALQPLIDNWALTLAYTVDWIVIVLIAAAGGGLNFVRPYHRPFSLLDLNISYPIESELSITTVFLVTGLAPAIIILLIVATCVPGWKISRSMKRADALRLKAWELEKGWAGLALALATSFFITQGSKQLFGKPRPNMLARCQPDLTDIASHVVGGYGQSINPEWTLVDTSICTTSDLHTLDDGFRSFPSGHSSFSFAGLVYLTLFLCSKFSIGIPALPFPRTPTDNPPYFPTRTNNFELQPRMRDQTDARDPVRISSLENIAHPPPANSLLIRNSAASPPVHLLAIAFVPIAVAIYIGSTRYTDFYHFGFDIIAGSLLGICTAWISFRWYHLPLSRGHGWAWGARSKERAFGIGVGTEGYVESRAGGHMV
ncbi:hypothetical protein M409DRAFT_31050 [Zasmidium cellare ATCC 36951]|uniref:Phosphatidic acid phosphatase type 2/haloperoxidase domain-containing protein n=1 Tax=Zasmidium cellare ATCC 36951 TaxID=1080233 RepID=A0A6A6BWM0_ZASCE|nr:uncharacterized protein M409DRAFT_31050 [Zasmidium cellare ATCC 36951]KAF2158438.1 hypothetical protein M409DRAFT_31050 [Zasmidium cellare ATCC 36951]